MTALPIPQALEIDVEKIRTGWFRAFATVRGTTYAKASRTDKSWIAAAAYVWKEVYGSMLGFDDWVAARLGVVAVEYDGLPGLDDLGDFTIHGDGQ